MLTRIAIYQLVELNTQTPDFVGRVLLRIQKVRLPLLTDGRDGVTPTVYSKTVWLTQQIGGVVYQVIEGPSGWRIVLPVWADAHGMVDQIELANSSSSFTGVLPIHLP